MNMKDAAVIGGGVLYVVGMVAFANEIRLLSKTQKRAAKTMKAAGEDLTDALTEASFAASEATNPIKKGE